MTEVWRVVGGGERGGGRRLPALVVVVLGVLGPGATPSALAGQDPAAGSVARGLTVEESVRLGLEASPRVRAAEADAAAAEARQREARAGRLPTVAGQASYTRLGGDIPEAEFTLPGLDTTFTLLPIERNRYHTEVGVEQPLFTGGRLRHLARAATRAAVAAERLAEQERVDVALEVRRAYWTLLGALAALDATEAALGQMEEHVRDMEVRFEEGAVLRSELLAARTRRSEVALERVESQNAARVARLELNRLVGLPAATEVRPVAAADPEPLPADLAALTAEAVAARPHLQALGEEVAVLRAQAAAVRGGRLPDLAFVSRYVYARPNPYVFTEQSEFRGTWEAGVSVRWPLWEGGARGAREAEAEARLRAAEARLEEARELAAVDVARRYLEAERAAEAVQVAGENVEQAREALRVTRQQFAEGATLPSQVLDAERAHREAEARLARARAEHGIGRAALRHALGELW